jgi:hypothetical protein
MLQYFIIFIFDAISNTLGENMEYFELNIMNVFNFFNLIHFEKNLKCFQSDIIMYNIYPKLSIVEWCH